MIPCMTLCQSILPPFTTSVLVPGKHNSTPIAACTGYNPAPLTFTTATTGGTLPYTFQWQLNNSAIPEEVLPSYDPPQLTGAGTYAFNCAITDAAGAVVYTLPKTVTVVPDPYVTIAGGGPVCRDEPVVLGSTVINGTGTIHYQWECGPTAAGPFAAIAGATSASLVPATSSVGTIFYRLIIFPSVGSCNDASSSALEVTVSGLQATSPIYHL